MRSRQTALWPCFRICLSDGWLASHWRFGEVWLPGVVGGVRRGGRRGVVGWPVAPITPCTTKMCTTCRAHWLHLRPFGCGYQCAWPVLVVLLKLSKVLFGMALYRNVDFLRKGTRSTRTSDAALQRGRRELRHRTYGQVGPVKLPSTRWCSLSFPSRQDSNENAPPPKIV